MDGTTLALLTAFLTALARLIAEIVRWDRDRRRRRPPRLTRRPRPVRPLSV